MPHILDIPEAPTRALLATVELLTACTPKLHLSQVQVLLNVSLCPGKTQKELSQRMHMPQSSVSAIVNYLIDLDWVTYEGIKEGFVPVKYLLTAKGHTFVRMCIQSLIEYKHAH